MAKTTQYSATVNPALQRVFVVTFFAVWGLMLMNVAFFLFSSAQYTDMTYWYMQTLLSLLPGLMFAVAWWYVGVQKIILNRAFLASVIAFVGFMATTILQQLAFLIPAGTGGRVSDTAQVAEPLVAFAVYVAVIIWAKRSKV